MCFSHDAAQFKVYERLHGPGIEPMTHGLQGEWLYHKALEAYILSEGF